jgi:hypothetical protein
MASERAELEQQLRAADDEAVFTIFPESVLYF